MHLAILAGASDEFHKARKMQYFIKKKCNKSKQNFNSLEIFKSGRPVCNHKHFNVINTTLKTLLL